MSHAIGWFDIPVLDMARAMRFYSTVLEREIKEEFPGVAVMTHAKGDVAGCLYKKDGEIPSEHGPLLYFNVPGLLDDAVRLVPGLGGKIVQPKHSIGPYGFRAIVLDSEGNRIALHSE
jgi:predicted enzyme related to lactoylglutathione lyase